MSDIVERLRHLEIPVCDKGADEIARLRAERDEWKQAAQVEAGLRREFKAERDALLAAIRSARLALREHDQPRAMHALNRGINRTAIKAEEGK